jgi:putative oxidoreductase
MNSNINKMKNNSFSSIISIVLGAFLIVYALNQFFHFFPMSYGNMPDFTRDLIDATIPFLPALYVFEILLGLMLIWNKWVPLIAIVLAPLSISFVIFNVSNGGWNILSAAFVAVLNLWLLYAHRQKYLPLLEK